MAPRSRVALVILLAVTTGAADATAFERLGHAFASVITGNLVLLGVSAARGDGQLALVADLVVLVVVAVGWELSAGRPGRTLQLLLLAGAAAAMGMQSTAVRRLGPMSTTYLTSTFIAMFEAIAVRRWSGDESRSVSILAVAAGGAAGATALILHAPRLLPALMLGPLAIVIFVSRALTRQSADR